MFSKSTFSISLENYIYAKVEKYPISNHHFFVSQDKDEITVVTQDKNATELSIIEKNENFWRLVSVNLETPFMAGTLAVINTACAEKGLNNLVVSTYSKDYILVKESQARAVADVFLSLGFREA